MLGDILPRLGNAFLHLPEDMHPACLGLGQGLAHDIPVDTVYLDVHLQRGDPVTGTDHLEVHVAQVIFIAQNVREDHDFVVFLDQAHGDTGNRILDRHAGIHQCHGAATDRGHRG